MTDFGEMTSVFYTYLHCRPNGDPFYVGKGIKGRSHNMLKNRNKYHKNVVAKYGEKNIGIYVFPCESEQQAFEDEIRWIAQLRSEGFQLVNMTSGGDGVRGQIVSEETRIKLSIAMKGKRNCLGKTYSKEHRANIGNGGRGKRRAPRSVEWCAHISAAKLGKPGYPCSAETKAKIAISLRGRRRPAEVIAKMAASMTGKKQSTQTLERKSKAGTTVDIVRNIRTDFSSGLTNKYELGRRYHLSEASIRRIISGVSWNASI